MAGDILHARDGTFVEHWDVIQDKALRESSTTFAGTMFLIANRWRSDFFGGESLWTGIGLQVESAPMSPPRQSRL
jgi:hypothetical protein